MVRADYALWTWPSEDVETAISLNRIIACDTCCICKRASTRQSVMAKLMSQKNWRGDCNDPVGYTRFFL